MTLSAPPEVMARRRELVVEYPEAHPDHQLREAAKWIRSVEERVEGEGDRDHEHTT